MASSNDRAQVPYPPSWLDRLTAFIDRLPVPPWLVYLAATVIWASIFIGVQAWQGAYRENGFFVWHIFVVVQPLYGVMAGHYLDRVAVKALHRFQPVMKENDPEFDAALYRLTTLPARQTLMASILGGLFALVQLLVTRDPEVIAGFQNIAPTTISVVVHDINIVVAWFGYGAWFYHAYHQLRIIDWLYTSKAVIDPFYTEPLHALSEITSRSAIAILVALYGWFLVITNGPLSAPLSNPMYIFTNFLWLGLGLLVFILPLWGAHRLLVDAKIEALKSNAVNYKVAVKELHRKVTEKELNEVDMWHDAMEMLDMERRRLDRLATWPWSPGALRNLLVTMIIPILVWIVQYGLQRLLE
jgi:hypothetical protein